MKFEQLQRRVMRAEQLVEGRALQTRSQWQELMQSWRAAWTPGRIVVAGLVSGFLAGRAEPLRSMTGARWLQMAGSLSSLFASLQAATAADQATEAADTAQQVQEDATGVPGQAAATNAAFAPVEPSRPPEPAVTAPRPAEAATELSER